LTKRRERAKERNKKKEGATCSPVNDERESILSKRTGPEGARIPTLLLIPIKESKESRGEGERSMFLQSGKNGNALFVSADKKGLQEGKPKRKSGRVALLKRPSISRSYCQEAIREEEGGKRG